MIEKTVHVYFLKIYPSQASSYPDQILNEATLAVQDTLVLKNRPTSVGTRMSEAAVPPTAPAVCIQKCNS